MTYTYSLEELDLARIWEAFAAGYPHPPGTRVRSTPHDDDAFGRVWREFEPERDRRARRTLYVPGLAAAALEMP